MKATTPAAIGFNATVAGGGASKVFLVSPA
jgi:hypothetical protein